MLRPLRYRSLACAALAAGLLAACSADSAAELDSAATGAPGPAPATPGPMLELPGTVTIGNVRWHTDLAAAREAARAARKPIWLHFGENPG